jgi:2-methylcitrate dehydratase
MANMEKDNLGALFAVSDWLCRSSASGKLRHEGPPLTIRTLLEATIKAYEIQGCFLVRNAFNAYGLDHTILVKLASTAIVSWLLGLSEDQTMAAISHVFMDGSPLRIFRAGENTIPRKGWAAGDACMRAVHFALLTRCGQPGAPSVLTAPRWGFYANTWHGNQFSLPKPFGTWVIENVFFKLIPAEGHGISAIEAALQLVARLRERGLDPVADIKKIKVRTTASANMIINKTGRLYNAADRDHCMQYMLAIVFLKGAIPEVADYHDESPWATDLRMDALRPKFEIKEDERLTKDYFDLNKRSVASGITVVLHDGSQLEEVLVEFPIGHTANKQTLPEVQRKFKKNMRAIFSDEEIEGILTAIEGDGSISSFVDLFARKNEKDSKL